MVLREVGSTASHWGAGVAVVQDGKLLRIDGHPTDRAPSLINTNIASSLHGRARVLRPAIRESWLKHGPLERRGERGREPFVEVEWGEALDIIAREHQRVVAKHGNQAIYAGSYGWASAGRFHHAQGQLKRFLNQFGGFVRSEGNYSYNAALVLMPRIVGGSYRDHISQATRWTVVAKHSELVVMFGGMPLRNTQVSDGGVARHRLQERLAACAKAGVKFVNFSPLRSDVMKALDAEWLPPRPGTDTAIMMGLAHTLIAEGLHDTAFLTRYTVGFDRIRAYLFGDVDGIAKDAQWAAAKAGLDAERIRSLAREMATRRTLICTAAGLQRADYGEQPLWMTVTLAALLGQIGLPGGGYGIGYGVNANVGVTDRPFRWAAFPQGRNAVEDFIPVAMVSDMLLGPGGSYEYNGETKTFPDIRMVWWTGGNPFHHHQDLNRLRSAFQRPETIIVNEINWTATARHADIVLPCAAPQERTDFCGGHSDNALVPMPQLVQPPGQAMIEFDIFAELEKRMGGQGLFSAGRSSEVWLRELWKETTEIAADAGTELPDWDTFIAGDVIDLPDPSPDQVFLSAYRADPDANRLETPSGRLELYSETIASFGYDDCPGHATWFEPRDVLAGNAARYPLYLLSGQPETRLHSQLDNGDFSRSKKISGREPVLVNEHDARERGIADGDVVEIFNDRGRCLAGARVTDEIVPGAVFLWTGAWYDPDFEAEAQRDRHGNPNVLTHDVRTSQLTQGPAAHSALVEIRFFREELPPITVHDQPQFVPRDRPDQPLPQI